MKSIAKYLKWLYTYSKGSRRYILLNILANIGYVCVMFFIIFLYKKLIDIATNDQQGSLPFWAIVLVACVLLRIALVAFSSRLEYLNVVRMANHIRRCVYSRLLESKWYGKEAFHTGDQLNRLSIDVDRVSSSICSDLPDVLVTIFQLVGAFLFLSSLNWKLALIVVCIMPFFVGVSKIFFRTMRRLTAAVRTTDSQVQAHIQESLGHRVLIASLQKAGYMEERLNKLQHLNYSHVIKRTRFSVFSNTLIMLAFACGYLVAFLWGVFGIRDGSITFGTMTAFLQLVNQVQRPTLQLTRKIPGFINTTISIDRLDELLRVPLEEKGDPVIVPGTAGIRIEGLCFHYLDAEEDVLHEFDFDFTPGSHTAIIGQTGAGKSTLIRLMLALLHQQKGTITLYNREGDCAEASPLTRDNMVYVPQGNTLFSGTIRDNLLLGKTNATEEEMNQALHVAEADFVHQLPNGLETVCGEKGSGLSEGQAQRIAIARGLLRPGSILLLDEFSSSLDPLTEERLMHNLTKAAPDKTMIFITHREKIAQYCDHILRING